MADRNGTGRLACERVVTFTGLVRQAQGYIHSRKAGDVTRPKHRMPELEAVLRGAERQGWRVTGGGNSYFKMYCPCPEKHKKSVHCTPSDPNYKRNLLGELKRKTCWKDES